MGTFFKGAWGRTSVLAVFAVVVIAFLTWFFDIAGMRVPLISPKQYNFSFQTDNAGNLVDLGDVEIAGVKVGKIGDVSTGNGHATVTVNLDSTVTPLHEGAKVRVGAKTLIGESVVDITDGTGAALPSGASLPTASVQPPVRLDDVLRDLDPRTRQALGSLSRSLGAGTQGTEAALSNAATGLGNLGREGFTALDAISAQSQDLTKLAQQTSTLLAALDTGEGQIGTLVQNAQQLTAATSGQSQSLTGTVRSLPGVLNSAQAATNKLTALAGSLGPVAGDLKAASPYLSTALDQLPATTADLRGLLPSLDSTLAQAPATLGRVPAFATDVSSLVPQLRETMSNLNPMLGYLRPYGPDLAALFTNFSSILQYTDEADMHFIRLQPTVNEGMVKGIPVKLPQALVTYHNANPAPGASNNPGPGGPFPRLYPEPK